MTQTTENTDMSKKEWEPMKLTYVGDISKVVLGGGGKLSLTIGDPGEPQKCPPGTCGKT
jgi:hypothetical protein